MKKGARKRENSFKKRRKMKGKRFNMGGLKI
jgi:hypothetical protein